MKKFTDALPVVLLLLLALLCAVAYSQCPTDSLGGGMSGIGESDSARVGEFPSRCEQCMVDSAAAWILPDNYNGHLFINAYPPCIAQVQVSIGCSAVVLDTCAYISEPGPTGLYLLIEFAVVGTCQIWVTAPSGTTIYIYSKSLPSPQEELEPRYYFAGCSTVGIPEQPPSIPRRIIPYTLAPVRALKPNHKYLAR